MRVIIVEDSVLLREGLSALLADHDIEVVAASADADRLIDLVTTHEPDLAIVDVRLPPGYTDEGIRAALDLRRCRPDAHIVVLSHYVEQTYATELIGRDPTGIGYLLKDRVANVLEFVAALRRVAAGGTAIDPDVVAHLVRRNRHRSALDRLTSREVQVLGLVAQGRSNAAIAADVSVTVATIEKHISSIFVKLDLPVSGDHHRRVLAVLTYLQA